MVALWREALLARKTLRGAIHAYTNRPQLLRFKMCDDPMGAMEYYLNIIFQESQRRGYHFDPSKTRPIVQPHPIPITTGQLEYEFWHLQNKLKVRSPSKYREVLEVDVPCAHPLFYIVQGGIESWEKTKKL